MTNPLLKERAQLLAQEPPPAPGPDGWLEVLEFGLAGGKFCLETAFIGDVHPLVDVTPLPGTPAFIRGLIALRGRILCVVDLRRLLDLSGEPSAKPQVILLRSRDREFGIEVDSIAGTSRLRKDSLQPPLVVPGGGDDFTKGLTRDQGVLLDGRRILEDQSLIVQQGDTP